MAHLEQRRWPGEASGWTRRDRRPCGYAVYWPDAVADRGFVIDGDVAAEVADAEAALVYLDASVSALSSTEALARLLLRAECVASSRIEGLEVGARRLTSSGRGPHARRSDFRRPGWRSVGQHRCDVMGSWSGGARRGNHPRKAAGDASPLDGGRATLRAWRAYPNATELDRRQRLQSMLGGFRATATGSRPRLA